MRLLHTMLRVGDLERSIDFYTQVLGATQGRSATTWVDIDLFGNQITFINSGAFEFHYRSYKFEDAILPAFHFGVLVSEAQWNALRERLQGHKVHFSVDSQFLSQKAGSHKSFFVEDPNGYFVEFKQFTEPGAVFAAD